MTYIGKVTFYGEDNDHEFEAYTTNHQFSDVGAVYILSRREGNSYISLYIGETSQLKKRLQNHEKWPCARRNNVNCICVHYESNSYNRRSIEKDLLRNSNPPCND